MHRSLMRSCSLLRQPSPAKAADDDIFFFHHGDLSSEQPTGSTSAGPASEASSVDPHLEWLLSTPSASSPDPPTRNLIVRNVAPDAREEELMNIFKVC